MKLGGNGIHDEMFIGGKAPNMHRDEMAKVMQSDGATKPIVAGVLERDSRVRTKIIPNRSSGH
jgi:hypothetical protein